MVKLIKFFLFFLIATPLQASQGVLVREEGGISYYCIAQNEDMPTSLAQQAKEMIYNSYDPKLHDGLTLEDMGLKDVDSYEEFLEKLLAQDMQIYIDEPGIRILFYACEGPGQENYANLAGFCSLLPQKDKGHYYLDHIAVNSNHQRKGIGSGFMNLLPLQIKDMVLLTLDTRTFNTVSKPFYTKHGFELIQPHPVPSKEGKYLIYQKKFSF